MQQLRMHFRPEFLNRIDDIIIFKPLTKKEISHIVKLILGDLNKRLSERNIEIEFTDRALEKSS
jgi:ATP-dependent Clp protease ATP-binding subunit ClpB